MLTLILSLSLAVGESPAWTHFTLANGVRVSVWHVPGAKKESAFTLLPLSLVDDGPGRAQFAHLIEHMLIRSTDAQGLQADGVTFNGETGALGLRLESFADPADWQAGLERHVRWLATNTCDAAVLAREKQNIASEESSTIERGYGHKWAQAAWNQIVRCGRAHAAVHGDVEKATPSDVLDDLEARLVLGPSVRLVVVGPVDPKAIRDFVTVKVGSLARDVSKTPVAKLATRAPGDVQGTWDLAGRHYLEWYPWAMTEPEDRAAAMVLVALLNSRLATDARLKALGATALAAADLRVADQHFVSVSASIPAGADGDAVRQAVRQVVSAQIGAPEIAATLAQATAELAGPPDLDALRKRMGAQADLLEAQLALTQVHLEMTTGLSLAELAKTCQGLTASRVSEMVRARLKSERRSSLMLAPAS